MKEIKKTKTNKYRLIRTILTLMLAFTVIFSMSGAVFAGLGDAPDVSAQEATADSSEGANAATDSCDDADTAKDGEAASNGNEEVAGEEAAQSEEDAEDEVSAQEGAGSEDTDAEGAQEEAEEEIDMTDASTLEGCDFTVLGEDGTYSFDPETGVLTITGDVTVAMAEGKTSTGQRIVVADSCKVTLNGVDIKAAEKSGPGILIRAESNVNIVLAKGSTNNVTGAHGSDINATSGGYAGIEVEFLFEEGESPSNKMASLTISGSGTLNATGGPNAAGIGGSNSLNGSRGRGLYGNITINGGNVTAVSPGSGAGIGSSNNPNGGTSIGSYKATGNNAWGTITINGGSVNAKSTGSGAGIGGGNHVDSSKIVINGGTVTADGAAGIGCGIGSSKNKGYASNDKGPGYYYADVTITGGNITATSNDIGAAIGGGMYCDAIINISGGTINATGGDREGKTHHGGAGIGGGYLGHADITITGGEITAVGGDGAAGIGSGGSPNSNEERGVNGRGTTDITTVDFTKIEISGGKIDATGGVKGGAGIGLGVGADKAEISITGGDIIAKGAASERFDEDVTKMAGGSGIGSAFSGISSGSAKYFVEADVDISITGGTVVAIGGWGASGVGSGAQNKMANNITIDAANTDLQAYSDGTKFAIDTRILNDDGSTTSREDGRKVSGNLLQGTFVHNYKGEGDAPDQSPEGLKSIVVTNDNTGDSKTLTMMPEGYRSYATNVADPGTFTVYTDDEAIGAGQGRYFSTQTTDVYNKEEAEKKDNLVQYSVETGKLSDNFYLFPVKSVIVEKIVDGNPDDVEGLNATAYFGICYKDDEGETVFLKNDDGTIWTKSIEIVNGKPQGKAYFVNLDDRKYDVREIKGANDTDSPIGSKFGSLTLNRITTQHGEAFGLDEATEHGFAVTTKDAGDDKVNITVKVSAAHSEDDTWSLSIFANGKLASDSIKFNKENDWTYTWTVDKMDAEGKAIEYTLADTSNNATIDKNNWSDEVKVINTYEGEGVVIKITKAIENYLDANNGETKKTANATFVFNVEAKNSAGTTVYENYVAITFDRYGEAKSEVLAIKGVTGIEEITVNEVYKAGYKMAEGSAEKQTIKLTGEGAAEKNEDGQYEFSFANEYDDTVVEGSGALNRYENKQYVTKASGQEEEPAA